MIHPQANAEDAYDVLYYVKLIYGQGQNVFSILSLSLALPTLSPPWPYQVNTYLFFLFYFLFIVQYCPAFNVLDSEC